jgi:hypothetical protein
MRHLLRSAPAALQHASVALCGANILIYSEQVFRVIRALHLGEVRIGFATKHRADEIVILSVAKEIEVHVARARTAAYRPKLRTPTGYWPRRLSVRTDGVEAQKTDAYLIRRLSSVLRYLKWHAA